MREVDAPLKERPDTFTDTRTTPLSPVRIAKE
jgi:hypothetical protein